MKLLLLPVLLFAVAEGGYRFGFGFDDCSWYGNCGYGYYGHYDGGYSDSKNYYGDYDYGYGGHGHGRYGKYKPHGGYIYHGKYKRDTDSQTKKDAVHVSGSLGPAVVSKLAAGFHAPHWASVHGAPQLSHEYHRDHDQHRYEVPAHRHEVPAPYEPRGKPHHEVPAPYDHGKPHHEVPAAYEPRVNPHHEVPAYDHGKPHEVPVDYDPRGNPHHEVPAPYDHGEPHQEVPALYESLRPHFHESGHLNAPHGQPLHEGPAPHKHHAQPHHKAPTSYEHHDLPRHEVPAPYDHGKLRHEVPAPYIQHKPRLEVPGPYEPHGHNSPATSLVPHAEGPKDVYHGPPVAIPNRPHPDYPPQLARYHDQHHGGLPAFEVSFNEHPKPEEIYIDIEVLDDGGARPKFSEGQLNQILSLIMPEHRHGVASTDWRHAGPGPEVYPPVHHAAAARPPVYQEEGPAHAAPHAGLATSWLYKNIAEDYNLEHARMAEPAGRPVSHDPVHGIVPVHALQQDYTHPHQDDHRPNHRPEPRPHHGGPLHLPKPVHDHEHPYLRPIDTSVEGHHVAPAAPHRHHQLHRPVVEGPAGHGGRRPEHLSGHYMPEGEPSHVIDREHTYEKVKEAKFSEFLMQNMGSYKA